MKKSALLLILIFLFNSFSFAEEAAFKDLSSEEKLFCMFSSNNIESNHQSHETLNPDSNGTSLSAQLLESSWSVSNYYELRATLDELYDYTHCDNYADFSDKFSKAKNETLIASAIEYGIPFNQLCFFLYIPHIKEKLGISGNMAWNYGRALTILRWAIGAGLIDEEEAKERAKPFIDAIISSFCSFEDFCCHYLYGASFFYCDYFETMPEIVKIRYSNFISFISKYGELFPEDIAFKGKASGSQALSFKELIASMSMEELTKCKEYFSIAKVFGYNADYENASRNIQLYLGKADIIKDFQSIEGTPYFYEVAGNILLNAGKIQDVQDLFEPVEESFESIPHNSSLYNNLYAFLTFSAFSKNDYMRAERYSDKISDDYSQIADIYHLKALCYTYRFVDAEKANDSRLADEFLKQSINMYIKAYKKGYTLNSTEQEYVLRYSGLTIEQHILPAEDFWKI